MINEALYISVGKPLNRVNPKKEREREESYTPFIKSRLYASLVGPMDEHGISLGGLMDEHGISLGGLMDELGISLGGLMDEHGIS